MWEHYPIGKDDVEWGRTRSRGNSVFKTRILSLSSSLLVFLLSVRVVGCLKADLGIGFHEFLRPGFFFVLSFYFGF